MTELDLDALQAENATLTERVRELEARADLTCAQLCMVGSELCADPKIDPADTRDPRHTPVLLEDARLRADNAKLRAVAYLAVQIVAAYYANLGREETDEIIRDLSDALATLEAS